MTLPETSGGDSPGCRRGVTGGGARGHGPVVWKHRRLRSTSRCGGRAHQKSYDNRHRNQSRPGSPASWSPSRALASPCSSATPPRRRPRAGVIGGSFLEKGDIEVYVGCLPKDCTPEELESAFVELFKALPEYRARYPDPEFNPIGCIHKPRSILPARFSFVQFVDVRLASTACMMTGLRVCGVSVKVSRGNCFVGGPGKEPYDVSPLRMDGRLPFSYSPGARMLTQVWLGGSGIGTYVGDAGEKLRRALNAVLLSFPVVRNEYPEIAEPVTYVKLHDCYAFATLANEVFASTLVAMVDVHFRNDILVHVGWPSAERDAQLRAPLPLPIEASPPLALLDKPQEQPSDQDTGRDADGSTIATLPPPPLPISDVLSDEDIYPVRLGSELDCEIFIGGVYGVERASLMQGLVDLFRKLPSFREKYTSDKTPVVGIRTGRGPFAFARVRDPVLASTAVAIGEIKVNGLALRIQRCANWKTPPGGPAPPLELQGPKPKAALRQKPRDVLPVTLWVGNIAPADADSSRLDQHLTRLAMEAPGYDLESGPPLVRVLMHRCGRFAFVDVRDQALAEQLIPIFDGSVFCGRPLAVNYSMRERIFTMAKQPNFEEARRSDCDVGDTDNDHSELDPEEL